MAKTAKTTSKAKKSASKKSAVRTADAEAKKEEKKPASKKYYYAVGRRKRSVAQVRLYSKRKGDKTTVLVNDSSHEDYFGATSFRSMIDQLLEQVHTQVEFSVLAKVNGGGTRGQVEAVRLGIARALVLFKPELRKQLKDVGFLTRDPRKKERKKPGLKKARKAPQWSKR